MVNLGLFILGALALIIAPGPDFLYVMSRGMAQGRRAGVLSAVGISLGLLTHTLLAALGLTTLLAASAWALELVKYAGAVYLFYVAVQILRKGKLAFRTDQPQATVSPGKIVQQGILTNLFNPKAVITFMAFIPQFIVADSSTPLHIIMLGILMAVFGLSWFSLVGYFSGTVGARLFGSPYARIVNWVAACVLIGLGVRLALTGEPTML